MGAWGVELYQNDVYLDLNAFYTALLRYGISDEEALKYTLHEFNSYIKDAEDGKLFWISLAEIMWKLGRLNEEIKLKALACVESSLELCTFYSGSTDIQKKVLIDLRKKLTSKQPEKKQLKKKRYKKCTWTDGNIYRYRFTSEIALKYDMLGSYLFLQKIGDYFQEDTDFRFIKSIDDCITTEVGDVFPIVRFWISNTFSFIPTMQDRNECIPSIGIKGLHNPKDYRFYIFNLPNKCDKFEFVCNSAFIVPDNEDINFIKSNHIEPKHLTWKFFEKHVIGRYLCWTKGIDIFGNN